MTKLTYEEESALIKKLLNSVPKIDTSVNLYHSNNMKYHQVNTEIADAYWRRRMLSAVDGECAPG